MESEIFKIIGIGLITVIAVIIVKQTKPEIAILVGVAGSVLVFFFIVDLLSSVFGLFNYIVDKSGINNQLFTLLLKIVGVGYLTEFAANIASDSGNNGMASKIQLGGKLTIFVLAIPIITELINIIVGMLP
ncbi:MAG: stage III sporulation AC/AD family protein [Firmicutes bacterium]|nr:stage III sporulation AC/AD family protein [Bacillota bacterium]